MWQRGNPYSLLVGISISTTTKENSVEVPQKLKLGLSHDSAISLQGI
jgi:hypothetical protein